MNINGRTNKHTDTTDRITFPANAVGNKLCLLQRQKRRSYAVHGGRTRGK